MTAGRTIAALLLLLTGLAGCASTGGASAAPPTPQTVSPSQIFNDIPQSP